MRGKISIAKKLQTPSRKPPFLAGSLSWLDGQITLHVGHCASTAKGQKIFWPSATLTKEDATRKTLPHCQNQVLKNGENRVPCTLQKRVKALQQVLPCFLFKSKLCVSWQNAGQAAVCDRPIYIRDAQIFNVGCIAWRPTSPRHWSREIFPFFGCIFLDLGP